MRSSYRSLARERHRTMAGTFAPGKTIGKVIRDADTMRAYARYVIELDHRGDVVDHAYNPHGKLDCIVVLAPARFNGERVDYAVALEIGLHRFVPYQTAEFKAQNPRRKKQIQTVRERTFVGVLPWSVVRRLLPVLWLAIQTCVDKRMETWTRANLIQEVVNLKDKIYAFEAWCTIRIPKSQPLLYAVLRLKDEIDRQQPGKPFVTVTEIVHREITEWRKLKASYCGNYPDELIEKSTSLWQIASWMTKNIKYKGYTSRSIEAIRSLIGKRSAENLHIFDEALRVFKVPKANHDLELEELERALGKDKDRLLSECTLRPAKVARREKNRTRHAKDCYTISILGSKEHLERLTERNIANRLRVTSTEAETSSRIPFIPNQETDEDNDIPWLNNPSTPVLYTGTTGGKCPF